MHAIVRRIASATILAIAVITADAALAAAPDALDPPALGRPLSPMIRNFDYQLGKEMVVHNWVLCVSQPFAEAIAKARVNGVSQALATYTDLKAAKSCGQFPELHVVLHRPLYESMPDAGHDARVFSAAVNIAGGWADAFLVYGGLPDNQ